MVLRLLLLVAMLTSSGNAWSAEPIDTAELQAVLALPILAPGTPLAEVQSFTEGRILPPPAPSSAQAWQREAERLRGELLDRVVFRGAKAWRDAPQSVEWLETIPGGAGYTIRKLRYEAVPGLWIPALLYQPEKVSGRVPVALNTNGHDRQGNVAAYKQALAINQVRRGMIALNVEWLGMGQLTGPGYAHGRMNQLDLCGVSGLAPFYLAMQRGLDVLLSLEHADPQRVAMTGLSGGGWQTILLSALDTRITLSNPVAGYSSLLTRVREARDLGDSEQTPVDLASVADYTHLTAMLAPRAALLTYNAKDDCCFVAASALPPLLDAARPVYKLLGCEQRLYSHINYDPGNHNFERDNREAFYRAAGQEFFAGGNYNAQEIDCTSEVKTADPLRVELPARNADIHSLAVAAAADLPHAKPLPKDRKSAETWQEQGRADLIATLRAQRYDVVATSVGSETQSGLKITRWKLKLGHDWTVPAVEIVPAEATTPRPGVLLLPDGGRAQAAAAVQDLLQRGHSVLAIDPFYLGESKIEKSDYLFALLVSAVGSRPLGVQVSQVAAIARWWGTDQEKKSRNLFAVGPRCSAIALAAAAIEPSAIQECQLNDGWGTFKEIIRRDMSVEQAPELFSFGLLESCDVVQLIGLIAPRKVTFLHPTEQVRSDLQTAAAWYALWHVEHDPLSASAP